MIKTPKDSLPPNPLLEYPGYLPPWFLSTILGEFPNFAFPDWGPIPGLPEERRGPAPPPPPRNPNESAPIEVDPPARPPEWLFGPPRIVGPPVAPKGLAGMLEDYLRG